MSQPNEFSFLETDPSSDDKNTSGRKYGKLPSGVAGWSWGGFLLTPIWSIFNNTFIGLLFFVPGIGLSLSIYLGLTGRELAWKNKRWKSVEHFNQIQRRWSIAAVIVNLILLCIFLFFPVVFDDSPQNGANREISQLEKVLNEGNVAIEHGDFDTAAKNFTEAIRLDPHHAGAYVNRGIAMEHKYELQAAIQDYSEAMRLDPNEINAANNLAWLLATCADDNIRDSKLAIILATKACKFSSWRNPQYMQTLAAANADAGDWENAIKRQTRVIKLVTKEEQKRLASHLLELYEQKTAYREPRPRNMANEHGQPNGIDN